MMPVPHFVFLVSPLVNFVVQSFDHKVHKDFHKEHKGKNRVFSRRMMESLGSTTGQQDPTNTTGQQDPTKGKIDPTTGNIDPTKGKFFECDSEN